MTVVSRPSAATSLAADSLALALHRAAFCIDAVATGRSLNDALDDPFVRQAQGARGAIQDLSFYALRRYGLASELLKQLAHRPLDAQVHALLLVALALLSDTKSPKYPDHTLVDQAVRAAAALPGGDRVKSVVNGILRTFLRERAARFAAAQTIETAQWNLPPWWLVRLQKAYPQQWQAIALAAQEHPPLTLRANLRVNSAAALAQSFVAAGIEAQAISETAVVLPKAQPITSLPGYKEGAFSVQDAAAQLAAPLLDAHSGHRVLDACAAPGGKTAHLLERTDCSVVALDVDAQRLARVRENLTRLKLAASIVRGDAAQPSAWWDGTLFDRILLDAPCSASGIVRRHPDIAWLRRDADIARLASLQRTLLDALWPLLKVSGRLLYVTCSVFPEEGEAQASAFVQRKHDAKRLNAPGQLLPTAGQRDNHDGFFYALFEKTI
ncbi:MAG: 16S rRNA (cytosine(967)-C(5))-methyltransferase RsmB [Burkholderiaceae bacterium]